MSWCGLWPAQAGSTRHHSAVGRRAVWHVFKCVEPITAYTGVSSPRTTRESVYVAASVQSTSCDMLPGRLCAETSCMCPSAIPWNGAAQVTARLTHPQLIIPRCQKQDNVPPDLVTRLGPPRGPGVAAFAYPTREDPRHLYRPVHMPGLICWSWLH